MLLGINSLITKVCKKGNSTLMFTSPQRLRYPQKCFNLFFFFIKNALSGMTVVTGNKSGTGNKNLELTLTFFDVVCR